MFKLSLVFIVDCLSLPKQRVRAVFGFLNIEQLADSCCWMLASEATLQSVLRCLSTGVASRFRV
jgi:hypothetical protein